MKQTALRSGDSYWRKTGLPPATCPAFDGDLKCDVAVVGAGITGTLVGYFLSRAGLDVVLCDQGAVGAGSTAASTGLLQYEVDTPLVDLISMVGETHALRAYRRGLEAIDELGQLISDVDPENRCGFSRRSTLWLASSEHDLPDLHREYQCRREFGFDVTFLERAGLREFCGFSEAGALLSAGDAQVDPYRLTQALLRAARSNGLRAFSGARITALAENAGGVELSAPAGRIRARAAVFATGYFPIPCSIARPAVLRTTYATVSEPVGRFPQWPGGCLIWETARPYFYARQTADGRALIGGEDTAFSDDHEDSSLLATKTDRLKRRFERMFPAIQFEPAFAWAGTFAETDDGLPFIGRPADSEPVYVALGYGGNGITFSMIAARLITDLILQRPNEDAAVFRFGR